MQLSDLGGCQNYGPFLGTLSIRCRILIGLQKGTIILTTTHLPLILSLQQTHPVRLTHRHKWGCQKFRRCLFVKSPGNIGSIAHWGLVWHLPCMETTKLCRDSFVSQGHSPWTFRKTRGASLPGTARPTVCFLRCGSREQQLIFPPSFNEHGSYETTNGTLCQHLMVPEYASY